MRRIAIIASILVLAAGCDKSSSRGSAGNEADSLAVPETDFSDAPTVLFSVFGAPDALRVAPIAVARGDSLEAINLAPSAWRDFDTLYFAAGKTYPVYRNGVYAGSMAITRGMWEPDAGPLYTVPGCPNVIPQAVGRLSAVIPLEATVELLGSSDSLPQKVDRSTLPRNPDQVGRALADSLATEVGIGHEDIASHNFHARWLRTGVKPHGRTLLASYVDPDAGDLGPGAGNTAVVIALYEDSSGTMRRSYQHTQVGEARSVEFQRVVNYADINNDSIGELFMESWHYGALPSLMVMRYRDAQWREAFRTPLDWCVRTAAKK